MTNIIPFPPAKTESARSTSASNDLPVHVAAAADCDPSIPLGYALFPDGIYLSLSEDGAPLVPVCSPIRADAIVSNSDGTGWGKIISVRNADGGWQDVHVTNVELEGSSNRVLSRLINCGLELAPTRKAKEQLLSLLKQWKPACRMTTVSKLGWVGDTHGAFAMPDGSIGSDAVLPVIPAAGLTSHLTCRGSAEEWKQAIGMKCVGNPLMLLAVSLAFSGPLLSIVGIASGGLHFRGSFASNIHGAHQVRRYLRQALR